MDMNIRFDNKVVLITGGSAGIGLAAAELFGSLGARVSICGTNPDKLERAAAGLRDKGVTEIEALGQPFDPEKHNAVMHVEDENAGENTVVEVFQKGFIMGDKVLRFSVVKVAN